MDFLQRANAGALRNIADKLLKIWPEHQPFLERSFEAATDFELERANALAAQILEIGDGGPAEICADYRWTCERLLEEELEFRRTGAYRYSSFSDVEHGVYGNAAFMKRYMNGLLLSQILWANHRNVINFFLDRFFPAADRDFTYLEIGPGHGLMIVQAVARPNCIYAEAWDYSEAGLAIAERSLARLGYSGVAEFHRRDVNALAGPERHFDRIVISEVLEHIEQPLDALTRLGKYLEPGGRIFVNVPVNSPAPDHIYLLASPEESLDLVRDAGLEIEEFAFFPCTGHTEERARKIGATISCVIVAGT